MINQNAQSLVEISGNYDNLVKERDKLLVLINNYKLTNKREEYENARKELERITKQIENMKYYMIKLMINMQKLIDEEKK